MTSHDVRDLEFADAVWNLGGPRRGAEVETSPDHLTSHAILGDAR